MVLQEIELKGVNLISRHELRMQGKYTRFGFYPAPKRRVSVRLDGHPEINNGDLMVFVMRRKDGWGDVLAWRNKTSGEQSTWPRVENLKSYSAIAFLALLVTYYVFFDGFHGWRFGAVVAMVIIFFVKGLFLFWLLLRSIRRVSANDFLKNFTIKGG